MDICKYLTRERIFLDVALDGKAELFQFLAQKGADAGLVKNRNRLLEGLQRREDIMSTGVGGGIGLPHAAVSEIHEAAILMVRLASPIDFEAIDKLPVDVVLCLILPHGETHLHLRLLAGLSKLCKNKEFISSVRQLADAESLWKSLRCLEDNNPFS